MNQQFIFIGLKPEPWTPCCLKCILKFHPQVNKTSGVGPGFFSTLLYDRSPWEMHVEIVSGSAHKWVSDAEKNP